MGRRRIRDGLMTSPAGLPKTAGAVVVGGGVMGTSTAFHLAKMGMTDVVLLEKESTLGAMSTGQCAGGIRHQFSSETNVKLSIESIKMLKAFPEETGQDISLRFTGYLFLMTDPADIPSQQAAVAMQHELGVDTEWLAPEDLAGLIPQVNIDGVLAGSFNEHDGICDPNSVVQGYATGARASGVTILSDVEVTGFEATGGKVSSVHTSVGDIATEVVVLATGAWTPDLGRMLGVDIPIEPVRRQIVVTTPTPGLQSGFPFVLFLKEALYFHPEGPGVLTGKSNPNERRGYLFDVDPEWEMVHLAEAMERLPLLEDAGVLSHWAGLYEITPDAHPIFGEVPQVQGVHVMAGFSGHGFMHGPICGLLMAEEILKGAPETVDVGEFAYERFLKGDLNPELNVI